ncbi:hypothetical protein N7X57_15790 [Lactiplantibacillus paraplantarum]|uniref:hypothetical protein n=1 Tax=Lactiplantibacillus TaxID=2767842 RepID=UPI00132FB7C6|nr:MULTISPECIES: hypothetical protein [Lactiplantibacillus]MCW1911869.1 hypothetical protein [Lactiplantibacillus paraplantarum]USZ62450.1 hypothetical protein NHN12_15995 [Lactiplantibacillus plantarum]
MINQNNLNRIIASRTFKTNTHNIANQLVISDMDARELLCTELAEHRLAKCSNDEIASLLDARDPNLNWKVTYAARDVVSKYYRTLGRQAEHEYHGQLADIETSVIKIANGDKVEDITEYQLAKVVQQFATQSSRLFVDLLLRFGKVETMAQMRLTNKQFNRKLRNCLSYVAKHSDKFSLVTDRERDRQLYVLNSLNELFSIIDKGDKGDIQNWIDSHAKLTNELLADSTSEVHYQGAILNHWETASNKDKYAFIREAIGAQAKAQLWLDQSNEAIKEAGVSNQTKTL